jgi:D-alanyl-lipoteichoic acid acyltransferase DltB (MBOAT superfamily)
VTGGGVLLARIVAYVLLARACLFWAPARLRLPLFAAVNVATLFVLRPGGAKPVQLAAYLVLVLALFASVRAFATRGGRWPLIPLLAPIAALCLVKYVPALAPLTVRPWLPWLAAFVGISYLAFRCSHLVLEVRSGAVPLPSVWQYLAFALFIPTLSVGPISSYRLFHESLERPLSGARVVGRSCLRIVVGAAKYVVIGNIVAPLTFAGMMIDHHRHRPIDLAIAPVAYLLYLYANFSGFCDLAIGTAGLIGIAVPENFNRPFSARNVRDYWTRWHITLTTYLNALVFAPLSTALGRLAGGRFVNHGIALAIAVTFLLVGIWHGAGWSFVVFGALHALAVVVTHYYTLGLRRWLTRDQQRAYLANRAIRTAGTVATFAWAAFCMTFFANDLATVRKMIGATQLPAWLRPAPSPESVVWPLPLVAGTLGPIGFDDPSWIDDSVRTRRLATTGESAPEPAALTFGFEATLVHAGRGSLRISGDAQPSRWGGNGAVVGVRVLLDDGRTVDVSGRTLLVDLFVPADAPVDWVVLALATGDGASGPIVIYAARPVVKGRWTTLQLQPSRDPRLYVRGVEGNGFADTPSLLPLYLSHVGELRLGIWTLSPPRTRLTVYVDQLRWQ